MKNITETKVTHIKPWSSERPRNTSHGRSVIFTSDNTGDLIDQWFQENGIGDLKFKCATWNWLIQQNTREIAHSIRTHFNLPETAKISWSAYAGCSCPCSKGYIMEHCAQFPHVGKHIHMDVLVDEAGINRVKYCIVQATKKLFIEKTKREIIEMKDASVQQLVVTG